MAFVQAFSAPRFYGATRYHYRTLNGGPPNDGKPPSAPANPMSLPPPAYGPPLGSSYVCFPNSGAVAPSHSFQPPPAPSYAWYSPPQGQVPAAPPMFGMTGPQFQPGVSMSQKPRQPPGEGNRINGHVVKTDNNVGVLTPLESTTFHVLKPEYDFSNFTQIGLNGRLPDLAFDPLCADSTWTVRQLIERLGGTTSRITDRFGPAAAGDLSNVAIEEWFRQPNGTFVRGSCIFYNEPRAYSSLKAMGWGPEHGARNGKPPAWVMLYP